MAGLLTVVIPCGIQNVKSMILRYVNYMLFTNLTFSTNTNNNAMIKLINVIKNSIEFFFLESNVNT